MIYAMPLLHDRHVVAQQFRLAQFMRREEDRLSPAAEPLQEFAEMDARQRIEAGERLVENQQIGIAQQGLRDAGALEHALGVFLERTPCRLRQLHCLQQFIRAGAHGLLVHAADATIEGKQLAHVEVWIIVGHFRHVADARTCGGIGRIAAQKPHRARCRPDQTDQHLDCGRLSGAVRAEESRDLALPKGKREVLDGFHRSKRTAHAIDLKNLIVHADGYYSTLTEPAEREKT